MRHRNLRLYLGGQLVSLIGTWMQQLALSWLVYRLTGSPFWLGVEAFCCQVPTFAFGLFAGVLVDRTNLHRLLICTQALSAVQALVLAALTLSGKVTLAEIVILSLGIGTINAIDTPTRQSFIIQLIGENKKDLPNAIALNSSVMNATRLIGPALASGVVSITGEGVCFLLNAVSYVAVLFALKAMDVPPRKLIQNREPIGKSLKEGMRFAFSMKPIGILLVLLAALSLVGSPFVTLLPAMADQVLRGGVYTLGFLTTATGVGAFIASFWLATQRSVERFHWMIGCCAVGFAVSLICFAFSTRLEIAVPVLVLCGFGMLFQMAGSNIAIQTLVDDDKRGRVMSIFTLALMGIYPFGSLLVGSIAERLGILHTLMLCGSIYFVVSLWFMRSLRISAGGGLSPQR